MAVFELQLIWLRTSPRPPRWTKRRSMPNGLELCCPAAWASYRPFSRYLAGQAPRLFARQPGQHQRVVGQPKPLGTV